MTVLVKRDKAVGDEDGNFGAAFNAFGGLYLVESIDLIVEARLTISFQLSEISIVQSFSYSVYHCYDYSRTPNRT